MVAGGQAPGRAVRSNRSEPERDLRHGRRRTAVDRPQGIRDRGQRRRDPADVGATRRGLARARGPLHRAREDRRSPAAAGGGRRWHRLPPPQEAGHAARDVRSADRRVPQLRRRLCVRRHRNGVEDSGRRGSPPHEGQPAPRADDVPVARERARHQQLPEGVGAADVFDAASHGRDVPNAFTWAVASNAYVELLLDWPEHALALFRSQNTTDLAAGGMPVRPGSGTSDSGSNAASRVRTRASTCGERRTRHWRRERRRSGS